MKKLFLVLVVLSLFTLGASAQMTYGPHMPMFGIGHLSSKPVVLNGTLEVKDGFQFVRVDGGDLYALILPRLLGLTFDTPRIPYAPTKVVIQGYVIANSSVVVMDMVVNGIESFQRTPLLSVPLFP